jgi:2-isopropylmalate synthase
MDNRRVYIFDSTLRDGAQARGISFSLSDKLNMLKLLDSLGIDYIEAGNPASNPKEKAFFEKAKDVELRYAKLTAFGSTRRKNSKIEEDPGIQALLSADTETVAIFGKSWDLHVTHVLQTTLEENLSMVKDTLSFFKEKGKEVIFDAEHFFDGYKANPDYAMRVLEAAEQGGADCLVLCDTNGGTLTHETEEIVKAVIKNTKTMVGIHAHNDSETAVSNSIAAVLHGARHVQGTLIGFGERCGNARFTSIIPNLQLKMGYRCIPEDKMILLSSVAREAAEISNAALDEKLPYIGQDAFAHKGGMHIDGVRKVKESFEHIKPEWVGNKRNFLISEVAGRSALVLKLQHRFPELVEDKEALQKITDKLKDLEQEGYSFEGAESSFELMVLKELGRHKPSFTLEHFKVIDEHSGGEKEQFASYAVVKVKVDGTNRMAAAEGNGPVNALDKALREALVEFYPELKKIVLQDYKVRVLDTKMGTEAVVRVVIETKDEEHMWTTLGVSTDVIEASLIALIDSIEYKLWEVKSKKER